MFNVKRIEIIVPEHAVADVLELVGSHKLTGYTLLRGLAGRGGRGLQSGDGLVGTFSNAMLLLACEGGSEVPLLEALRPLLSRWGGLCLVSEAQALRH